MDTEYMPISLNWDNETQTILRFIFWNEWTVDEFMQIYEKLQEMAAAIDHECDVIVDMRTGSFIPKGNTIRAFRYMADNRPNNVGIFVFVTDDPAPRHLINTHLSFYFSLRRRQKRYLFMVETLEEAYELINQHRAAP